MLEFLMGEDPIAKREYIAEQLSLAVKQGRAAVLIVPEQENFDRDKELMLRCGEKVSNAVRITSFSHFCRDYLQEHVMAVKPRADETAVNVLMSLAVRQVTDELEIYGRHYRRPGRVRELVAFYNELSNAGFTPQELFAAGQKTSGSLRRKTRELSLIYTAFEGLLTKRFSTETDNMNVCAGALSASDELRETEFWFDDFRGFTGAQIRFMSVLLPRCRNMHVSLQGHTEGQGGVWFPHVQATRRRLKLCADKAGVEVRAQTIESLPRAGALTHLRQYLFAPAPEAFSGPAPEIRVLKAANRYEECELIALQAKKLLDEGVCRARDMAVLHRDEGLNAPLLAALKRCGVPVFEDDRRPLYSYPLVRLMLGAVELAAKGFATETVLSLLKTEMTGVSVTEAAALQNYVYTWQIDGARWERDFTSNPRGFGERADEASAEALAGLNAVRRRLVEPILKLREALRRETPEGDCRAVYLYLKEIDAAGAFRRYAEYLASRGQEANAMACAGVWDACMEHLNALRGALGDNTVSPTFFYELFSLILSGGTVGAIPPGIDKMTVGSVDRTRVLAPKVVFIPGFTEGAFPKNTAAGGLLSAKELRALDAQDLAMEKLPEEVYEEERLILYNALTLPEKYLFISYPAALTTGEKTEPSPVLSELERLFPQMKKLSSAAVSPSERVCSPETAFRQLAAGVAAPDAFTASLAALMDEDPAYRSRVAALNKAAAGAEHGFSDPAEALRLFGKRLEMSASKAEAYAKCPFSFFCRYGLGVEKLQTAKLDNRMYGNIIHKVLEEVLNAHLGEGLGALSDEQLRQEAALAVDRYRDTSLGGAAELPPHVLRALERLKTEIYELLLLRREEFSSCLFRTVATEFAIGMKDGIKGYEVPLPGGGTLVIRGSVDRVDLMRSENGGYVRVIDYKTGGKEFELADVFFGLNMQMLIYLFAICENGREVFGETIPAGVLYVPAKTAGKQVDRRAEDDEIWKQRMENGRMNGVILENAEVIRGMETAARGVYINARINEKGELEGKLLSAEEFGLLHRTIDRVLTQTGADIQRGAIAASPLQSGGRSPCDYCDYAAVCLREAGGEPRTVPKLAHKEAVQKLYEEARQ